MNNDTQDKIKNLETTVQMYENLQSYTIKEMEEFHQTIKALTSTIKLSEKELKEKDKIANAFDNLQDFHNKTIKEKIDTIYLLSKAYDLYQDYITKELQSYSQIESALFSVNELSNSELKERDKIIKAFSNLLENRSSKKNALSTSKKINQKSDVFSDGSISIDFKIKVLIDLIQAIQINYIENTIDQKKQDQKIENIKNSFNEIIKKLNIE